MAALGLEPTLDPLVPIAGGPGQASSVFYAASSESFEKIRRNRDIVLLDQRGIGRSARMDCDMDDDIIEGQMSPEQIRIATQTCLDSLPHDARFFTTSVAVTDLEALRVALGYEKFNLYGISYGTRVAQHFARRYPDSTRTVILDGVVPPQMALGPAIATEAQLALDNTFARRAEIAACAERFSEEELAGVIRLLSYHPSTVALIPFLIDEAANDRFVPLAAGSDSKAESRRQMRALLQPCHAGGRRLMR